jgi:uncharacterized protein (TIGR02271 family)
MDNKNNTVIALFDDYELAHKATHELIDNGFDRSEIHIASQFKTAGAGSPGYDSTPHEHVGGISGFFRNLFNDAPDSGPSKSNHPTADLSDEYLGHYAEAVRRGGSVVTVEVNGNEDQAVEVLNRNGAVDIDQTVQSFRESGYTGYDPLAPPYSAEEAARERETRRQPARTQTVPIVKEELQVGKRLVRRGGVRVFSHVIDEPVEKTINLREEHVKVERRQVDRPVSAGELGALKDQTIEVTESAEEPVINKRARVREEVVINKEAIERVQTVRDSIRRTEVGIESLTENAPAGNISHE